MIATWWGERSIPAGSLVRLPLIPFSFVFGAAAAARRAAYARGWVRAAELPVPTISVGNLTVGGTGKTPMVRWLAEHLAATGRRPLVFSSGFGARADASALDEEGASLARALPGVRVLQGRDPRSRRWPTRAAEPDAPGAIVLDDGFQKLGIRRDLDLVMLDATRPFGSGFAVPAGPLREWAGALTRAPRHRAVAHRARRRRSRSPGSCAGSRRALPASRSSRSVTSATTARSAPAGPRATLRATGVYLISAIAHPQRLRAR